MELEFTLISQRGEVGCYRCEWNFPFLPRIGERLHMENFFNEGKFYPGIEYDRIKGEVENVEDYIQNISWEIYSLTWLNQNGKIFPSYMMRSDE